MSDDDIENIGKQSSPNALSLAGQMPNDDIIKWITNPDRSDEMRAAYQKLARKKGKALSRKELGDFLKDFKTKEGEMEGRVIMRIGSAHAAAAAAAAAKPHDKTKKLATEKEKEAKKEEKKDFQNKVAKAANKAAANAKAAGPSAGAQNNVLNTNVARNQNILLERKVTDEMIAAARERGFYNSSSESGELIPRIGDKRKQHWATGARVTNKNPYYNYPLGRRRRRRREGTNVVGTGDAIENARNLAIANSNGGESNSESNSEKRRNKKIAKKGWLKNLGNKRQGNVLIDLQEKLKKATSDTNKIYYKKKIKELKKKINEGHEQQMLNNALLSRIIKNPLHRAVQKRHTKKLIRERFPNLNDIKRDLENAQNALKTEQNALKAKKNAENKDELKKYKKIVANAASVANVAKQKKKFEAEQLKRNAQYNEDYMKELKPLKERLRELQNKMKNVRNVQGYKTNLLNLAELESELSPRKVNFEKQMRKYLNLAQKNRYRPLPPLIRYQPVNTSKTGKFANTTFLKHRKLANQMSRQWTINNKSPPKKKARTAPPNFRPPKYVKEPKTVKVPKKGRSTVIDIKGMTEEEVNKHMKEIEQMKPAVNSRFPTEKPPGSPKYSLAKKPTNFGPPDLNVNLQREAVRRMQLHGNTGPARRRLNLREQALRNLNLAKKQLEQSEKNAKEKAKHVTTKSIMEWMKIPRKPKMIRQNFIYNRNKNFIIRKNKPTDIIAVFDWTDRARREAQAIKNSVAAQKIEDIQELIKKHPSNANTNHVQKNLANAMKHLEDSLVNQTTKKRVNSIKNWLKIQGRTMINHRIKAHFARAKKMAKRIEKMAKINPKAQANTIGNVGPYVVPPRVAPSSPPKKKNRLTNLQEEANNRRNKRVAQHAENKRTRKVSKAEAKRRAEMKAILNVPIVPQRKVPTLKMLANIQLRKARETAATLARNARREVLSRSNNNREWNNHMRGYYPKPETKASSPPRPRSPPGPGIYARTWGYWRKQKKDKPSTTAKKKKEEAHGNPIMTNEERKKKKNAALEQQKEVEKLRNVKNVPTTQKKVKKLVKRGIHANNNKMKNVVSNSNTHSNSMKNFVVETNSNANSNTVVKKKKKRNGRFFESNSNGGSA